MEINTNKWYIKFYLYLKNINYGKTHRLPQDICSLRTTLFTSLLLFILAGPTWIAFSLAERWNDSDDETNGWGPLLFNIFFSMLVIGVFTSWKSSNQGDFLFNIISTYGVFIWYFSPIIIIGSIIISFFIIKTLFEFIIKNIKKSLRIKKKIHSDEKLSVIKTMYKSWRDDFCTKIEWKNE